MQIFFFFYRLHCWANVTSMATTDVECGSHNLVMDKLVIFFTNYTVGQMQPVWQPHTCNVEAIWSCKNMQV